MAEQQPVHQHHHRPKNLTTSQIGTFYFAFGSNLSAHQMSLRLNHTPSSSVPVAIARLDSHAWIICERGYANVVSLPPPSSSHANNNNTTVWGVIYNMSAQDEARLDLYEGHDEARNQDPQINPDPATQQWKPYLQGGWDYNKHYLPVTVTKWLRDPVEYGVVPKSSSSSSEEEREVSSNPTSTSTAASSPLQTHTTTTIRALIYVDEFRTRPGSIKHEYVGRMNRAIAESVALGIPEDWVDAVLRKFVPAGVSVDQDGYVGTPDGYVEGKDVDWVGGRAKGAGGGDGDR